MTATSTSKPGLARVAPLYVEVLGLDRYRIAQSRFLPDRSYVVVE